MTRDEVLAEYAAIRASVDRVTAASDRAFSKAEGQRAARLIAGKGWKAALDSEDMLPMISDLALHEPGPNGHRAYARFLAGPAMRMDAADLDMARRMATSRFSIFRVAGRHEAAGIRVEDIMDADRHLWLMDAGLERTAPEGFIFAMRVLDAGRFHVSMFSISDFPAFAADMFAHDMNLRGRSLAIAICRVQMAGYLLGSGSQSA